MRRQVVIARYKEALEDFMNLIPIDVDVLVYNKGPDIEESLPSHWRVVSLPNVGSCDQTYAAHIVGHYDDDQLADLTIFLPASAFKNDEKKQKLQTLLRATDTHMILSPYLAPISRVFSKTHYIPRSEVNQSGDTHRLCPARVAPFKQWYNTYIGLPFSGITYHGMFTASRDDIKRTSLQTWLTLLEQLSECRDVEVAHFMERSWASLLGRNNVSKMSLGSLYMQVIPPIVAVLYLFGTLVAIGVLGFPSSIWLCTCLLIVYFALGM